ncbi:hypothetical protein [Paraburkholderia sp. BL10I2N1]|uniref:hypothetical protein n=1 Tax=Paraburkholderia sp. BL10I2N1 TaxID=1938796 RepID=UPI001FB7D03A|nr:hypothetical protein [Paraburkholderia sp. BL10I2N1]
MQEHAREAYETVTFDAPVPAGAHIRRRGEEVRAGQLLLPAGVRIEPAHIGVAAAPGHRHARCLRDAARGHPDYRRRARRAGRPARGTADL